MTENELDRPQLHNTWKRWKHAEKGLTTLARSSCRDDRSYIWWILLFSRIGLNWRSCKSRRVYQRTRQRVLASLEFLCRGMQHLDYGVVVATCIYNTTADVAEAHRLIDRLSNRVDPSVLETYQRGLGLLAVSRGKASTEYLRDDEATIPPLDGIAVDDSVDRAAALRVALAANWWRVQDMLCRDVGEQYRMDVVHWYEDHAYPLATYLGLHDAVDAFRLVRALPIWYAHDTTRCSNSYRRYFRVPKRPGRPPVS